MLQSSARGDSHRQASRVKRALGGGEGILEASFRGHLVATGLCRSKHARARGMQESEGCGGRIPGSNASAS